MCNMYLWRFSIGRIARDQMQSESIASRARGDFHPNCFHLLYKYMETLYEIIFQLRIHLDLFRKYFSSIKAIIDIANY